MNLIQMESLVVAYLYGNASIEFLHAFSLGGLKCAVVVAVYEECFYAAVVAAYFHGLFYTHYHERCRIGICGGAVIGNDRCR